MGLKDTIQTLEARHEVGHDVVQELADAYAEMILRKGSKRLILAWFDDLATLLKEAGRHDELVKAAGGVDPVRLGAWDIQKAVEVWMSK